MARVDIDGVFAGGGEMGRLMRSMDWSTTPLGPVSSWSQTLRTIVNTSLNSRSPILIWWGPELIKLYNDAYREVVGTKHPKAMGAPGREVWPEIWPLIGPMLEGVLLEGKATWSENQLLVLNRKGFPEECYFTFAYSPIRDEAGEIAGVYSAVTETTGQVQNERRLRTLRELTARTVAATSTEEACRLAAGALADNPADLPFALMYVLEASHARLVAAAGVEPGHVSRQTVNLTKATEPMAHVARTSRAALVQHLEQHFPELAGNEGARAQSALILPIGQEGDPSPSALLVAGLSPRAEFDDGYRSFLELVAGQVGMSIASARALEDARRLRDEFFTVASHELRTPLTTLGFQADGVLHVLKQAGPHDATAERCLPRAEKLRTQVTRLEQLIEDMLDVFSLDKTDLQLSREELDLAEVVTTIVDRLRNESRQANATITLHGERSMGKWDRHRIDQILTQLVSNAVKFGAGQPVDVRIESSAQAARITVRDRGIGVAVDAHERIFERYMRLAPTSQYGGFGLGLWIVHELVQAMGGTVRVESEPGAGAAFIVEMPRHR